jgi:hypothetical protein
VLQSSARPCRQRNRRTEPIRQPFGAQATVTSVRVRLARARFFLRVVRVLSRQFFSNVRAIFMCGVAAQCARAAVEHLERRDGSAPARSPRVTRRWRNPALRVPTRRLNHPRVLQCVTVWALPLAPLPCGCVSRVHGVAVLLDCRATLQGEADVPHYQLLHNLHGHTRSVSSVKFSQDGRLIGSSCACRVMPCLGVVSRLCSPSQRCFRSRRRPRRCSDVYGRCARSTAAALAAHRAAARAWSGVDATW